MPYPFYTGDPNNRRRNEEIELPSPKLSYLYDPANYKPDKGLIDAMNVAFLVRQPLLLTGEAGVGKTQFAYSVAWELGCDPPLVFEAKSTSTAQDLFYFYDTLGRFHAAQTGEGSQRSLDYITYNALGKAILLSCQEETVRQWLPDDFIHGGQRRSLVLIDEIDKAPRDFPNDLLNEIEQMYFKIPQFGNVKITANENLCPIVIITSNSEKNLSDAFLRRCAYYNIPFPDKSKLDEIVAARIKNLDITQPLVVEAIKLFLYLRNPHLGLRKKPSTAELISWLISLRGMGLDPNDTLRSNLDRIKASLGLLLKGEEQNLVKEILDKWLIQADRWDT